MKADDQSKVPESLVDSLTRFFTPTEGRRRHASPLYNAVTASNRIVKRESETKLTHQTSKTKLSDKNVRLSAAGKRDDVTINNQLNNSDKENQKVEDEKVEGEPESQEENMTEEAASTSSSPNKSKKEKKRGDHLGNLVDSLSHLFYTENESRSHRLPSKFVDMLVPKSSIEQPPRKRRLRQSSSTNVNNMSVSSPAPSSHMEEETRSDDLSADRKTLTKRMRLESNVSNGEEKQAQPMEIESPKPDSQVKE